MRCASAWRPNALPDRIGLGFISKSSQVEKSMSQKPSMSDVEVIRKTSTRKFCAGRRYRRHHFMAVDIDSKSIADEFLDHSNEEQKHADKIAARIVRLGGEPKFSPDDLAAFNAELIAGLRDVRPAA
jgi:DNA-binding ferritin-like protein